MTESLPEELEQEAVRLGRIMVKRASDISEALVASANRHTNALAHQRCKALMARNQSSAALRGSVEFDLRRRLTALKTSLESLLSDSETVVLQRTDIEQMIRACSVADQEEVVTEGDEDA